MSAEDNPDTLDKNSSQGNILDPSALLRPVTINSATPSSLQHLLI